MLDFIVDLLDSPNIETVWVDEALHGAAVDLLIARQDKTYSLCDAISFVLMRQRDIREVLTTDRHFEQEGLAPSDLQKSIIRKRVQYRIVRSLGLKAP